MMALLYLLMGIALILAYRGKQRASVIIFFIAWVAAIFWFKHHVTDVININL